MKKNADDDAAKAHTRMNNITFNVVEATALTNTLFAIQFYGFF